MSVFFSHGKITWHTADFTNVRSDMWDETYCGTGLSPQQPQWRTAGWIWAEVVLVVSTPEIYSFVTIK